MLLTEETLQTRVYTPARACLPTQECNHELAAQFSTVNSIADPFPPPCCGGRGKIAPLACQERGQERGFFCAGMCPFIDMDDFSGKRLYVPTYVGKN